MPMKFAEALAAWSHWDQSVLGGLIFADYAEERGLPPEYTNNWRRFLPIYDAGHITRELTRLTLAEYHHANKRNRRQAVRRAT